MNDDILVEDRDSLLSKPVYRQEKNALEVNSPNPSPRPFTCVRIPVSYQPSSQPDDQNSKNVI